MPPSPQDDDRDPWKSRKTGLLMTVRYLDSRAPRERRTLDRRVTVYRRALSRVCTIASPKVHAAHAGPTFLPRRITKHLGRGIERHAAGTARTCIHLVRCALLGCRAKHALLGTGEICSARRGSVAVVVCSYVIVAVVSRKKPLLPSFQLRGPSCLHTRPPCHFGPYSPATRILTPGSLRDASPRRPQTRRPGRPGLSLCHSYLPSRCSPIRLSNTLSTIVTPSRTFVATWFEPLLVYTWLPAMDVAGI